MDKGTGSQRQGRSWKCTGKHDNTISGLLAIVVCNHKLRIARLCCHFTFTLSVGFEMPNCACCCILIQMHGFSPPMCLYWYVMKVPERRSILFTGSPNLFARWFYFLRSHRLGYVPSLTKPGYTKKLRRAVQLDEFMVIRKQLKLAHRWSLLMKSWRSTLGFCSSLKLGRYS